MAQGEQSPQNVELFYRRSLSCKTLKMVDGELELLHMLYSYITSTGELLIYTFATFILFCLIQHLS